MVVRIIRRTRKIPLGDGIPQLADLESEQERDKKALSELQARIWARSKLMAAAKEYNQLSGYKAPNAASSKPVRANNGAGKQVEAPATPTPPAKAAPTKLSKGGGSYAIVLDVLRENQQGLKAREVGRKAAEHPEAAESLKRHVHYIYSILDNLQKRGEAEQGSDGKWRTKESGAPAGESHATH